MIEPIAHTVLSGAGGANLNSEEAKTTEDILINALTEADELLESAVVLYGELIAAGVEPVDRFIEEQKTAQTALGKVRELTRPGA